MRRHVALALLLALAPLAGCTDADTPAEEEPASTPAALDDPPQAADGEAPAPAESDDAPPANATDDTPPPAATNGTSNQTSVPPPPPPPRTREVTAEGSATLKARTPCEDPAPCATPSYEATPVEMALPEPDPAQATLIATWEAGQTTGTLAFNVTTPEGLLLAEGEGESPLTLVLPPEVLKGAGAVIVAASPVAPGAMVQQSYQLVLTLDYA